MPYVWDTFETYRLTRNSLEQFLRDLHGPYDYYIQVVNGYYQFWVPQSLTQDQREDLAEKRT
ncbi:hypothetical protein BS50DRAFT_574089 [Corynespora cassiicola Philippines]|uniref:Uncharacterized protein n=1 Tax=Corynespora cassiicola Philippines TaxID=1448308 RepID=A0A2T2NPM0_CORCC|nr:hypothetical protein BS50DRAFT_574089 [Corynespora cassiicola Philippines]